MDIEENLARQRESESRHVWYDVNGKEKRIIITKYLLTEKAIEYVYKALEKKASKKCIKEGMKKLQWRHRDGNGYSFDDLDKLARRLAG